MARHAESPPPGYNRRDKPLAHEFHYKYNLTTTANLNSTMETFFRSSADTLDPKIIEVNPRNAAFAVDKGTQTCPDSIIRFITIDTSIMMHYVNAFVTDKMSEVIIYWQNIHGQWEDSWTPADESTTTQDIKTILALTSDTTKDEVFPNFSATNLTTEQDHPLSTVTAVEVFSDLALAADASMESVPVDIDEYFDALHHYTNGGKLKTLTGPFHKVKLSATKFSHFSMRETRMVPKNVQFQNPHTFFGRRYLLPLLTSSYNPNSDDLTMTDAGGHVTISTKVRFNEWNPDFEQSRM